MRFCELPISSNFHRPVPGSVFSWGGHEYLVRVSKYRAIGPHPNQEWIFQGDEIVKVQYTGKDSDWK